MERLIGINLYLKQIAESWRFTENFSFILQFPGHSLDDDILYVKANVFRKQKQYEEAIQTYTKIIENYPEEIRCDNAMFEIADLYELLDEKEKAKVIYEKIFIDYSNSTFIAGAVQFSL